MSSKGLEVIDHTVQETHIWVNELRDRLGWSDHRDALRFLRVVLRAVRDHLPAAESAQFASQMPLLLRGMYFEGWRPALTPIKDKTVETFIATIEGEVGNVAEYRGTDDIGTVFMVINNRISRGEVADVRANLPRDILALWPEP